MKLWAKILFKNTSLGQHHFQSHDSTWATWSIFSSIATRQLLLWLWSEVNFLLKKFFWYARVLNIHSTVEKYQKKRSWKMSLSAKQASREHVLAVSRDFNSQPRLSKWSKWFFLIFFLQEFFLFVFSYDVRFYWVIDKSQALINHRRMEFCWNLWSPMSVELIL